MISGRLEKGLAMGYQLASVGLQPGARVAPSHAPQAVPPAHPPLVSSKMGFIEKGLWVIRVWAPVSKPRGQKGRKGR